MVPNGWKRLPIKDTCESIIDCVNKTAPVVCYETPFKMIRTTNVRNGKVNTEDVRYVTEETYLKWVRRGKPQTGDIIFTREAPVGEVGVLENAEGIFLGQRTMMYRANAEKSDNYYLFYSLLSSFCQKQIEDFSNGGTVAHMRVPDCSEILLNLPPLPEQQKIAKILSTWDKAISTTERLIDNSKQQKKALMQQLLTGKKRLLDDSGKPFEGEWEEITLEKLAKYRRGSFPQPYGNPEWVDEVNGYPFIQVYDIDKNMKLKPDTKIKISDTAIGKSVFIPKETVIVSLQGSIGRVAITQYDAYVDRTVLLFQKFIVPMDKVFFAFIIQELFEIEKTKAPGGTIKTITKEVLSNFKVHIPSIKEQQKIASVLINADQEIELLEQQLADLKQEKKALMQQLLTGKRRVKVEQTDLKAN